MPTPQHPLCPLLNLWLNGTLFQVDAEELVTRLHDAHITEGGQRLREKMTTSHLTPYSTKYATQSEIPKYRIPQEGAPADAVYQLIQDELDLDGKPNLNLARCVANQATAIHRLDHNH